MARNLIGMVVVITGASAGIGRALASHLSSKGAKLVLAARRINRLEELNQLLGGKHLCVQSDVSNPADCEKLIRKAVLHFERIDTLVCNAGYGLLRPVAKTSPEQMRQIFQTNLFGTADCIRAAVPVMLEQEEQDGWRGQIVIVSSAAARRGLPYFGAYSATKAAQLSLSEALRVEVRPRRIAVTSVHPVGTDTEFFQAVDRPAGTGRTTGPVEIRQSAEKVARKIARAIVRPRPEVWPHRASRWALTLATFAPRIADRVMSKRRVERAPSTGAAPPDAD